jgi:hypothetical protein
MFQPAWQIELAAFPATQHPPLPYTCLPYVVFSSIMGGCSSRRQYNVGVVRCTHRRL